MNESVAKQPAKQKQLWRVLVRHTPLIKEHKSMALEATDKNDAWKQFIATLEEKVTPQLYHDGSRYRNWFNQTREWIDNAKKNGIPEGSEICPDDYFRERAVVIRIRGAAVFDKETAQKYPELVAAHN